MILKNSSSRNDLFCKPQTYFGLKNLCLLLKLGNFRQKWRVYMLVNLKVMLESLALCQLLPVWSHRQENIGVTVPD